VFRVVSLFGKPIIAVLGDEPVAREIASRVYPRTTLRKRLFADLVLSPRLQPIAWRPIEDPLAMHGIDGSELIRRLQQRLGRSGNWPVLIWPRGRQDRVHVHFVNSGGDSVSFAKIKIGADSAYIKQEHTALERLRELRPQNFRIPEVLGAETTDAYSVLMMEGLPFGSKRLDHSNCPFPEPAVAEWSGAACTATFDEIQRASWYDAAISGHPIGFEDSILKVQAQGGRLCWIHGDLGSENLFLCDGVLWVVDWECSCEAGPVATDYTAYWLGAHLTLVKKNPLEARSLLFDNRQHSYSKAEQVLALMYLAKVGFGPAIQLLHS